MIKRLLVANRGEIAARIMATAAVLGIETVELPGTARPPTSTSAQSPARPSAWAATCCTRGYGFLPEQPRLAERCAEAGVRFVGPAPGALALFGAGLNAAQGKAWPCAGRGDPPDRAGACAVAAAGGPCPGGAGAAGAQRFFAVYEELEPG